MKQDDCYTRFHPEDRQSILLPVWVSAATKDGLADG